MSPSSSGIILGLYLYNITKKNVCVSLFSKKKREDILIILNLDSLYSKFTCSSPKSLYDL